MVRSREYSVMWGVSCAGPPPRFPVPAAPRLREAGRDRSRVAARYWAAVESLDPEQSEHQVLRADARVAHALSLVDRKRKSLLGFFRQRQIRRGAHAFSTAIPVPEQLFAKRAANSLAFDSPSMRDRLRAASPAARARLPMERLLARLAS